MDVDARRIRTALCVLASLMPVSVVSSDSFAERAREIHFASIVVDTHDDTTQRLFSKAYDLGKRNPDGHVDVPRLREGGVGAVFFAVYMDGRTMGPAAVQAALDQIDAIRESIREHEKELTLCRTAADIRAAHARGKIAVLIGIEGGQMIGNDMRVLRLLADLGARYMTLAHSFTNEWADSSNDAPVHNGLTDFGKGVVREMNRRGILVDISHVSDKAFYDALAASRAPLIASHSSCRALSNHPRNLSDPMIKDLAAKGGVVQINFEKTYLDQAYREAYDQAVGNVFTGTDDISKACGGDNDCYWRENVKMETRLTKEGKLPVVGWEKIVEHIDHVVRLVGPDHVGLGSDFDGASMPDGMEDCSKLPRITEGLVRRGYGEDDIRKILGGNVLRVLEDSERVSREMLDH
jgi:membrane dipeptidase